MHQKKGDGLDVGDDTNSPTKSVQTPRQMTHKMPVEGKGEVDASNKNTVNEEDIQSTTRKNNGTQGESVVEIDKEEKEVQSHTKATNVDKGKEEHSQSSTNRVDNIEDSHTKLKEGMDDEGNMEEDIQQNIKEISKSEDLSPWSVKELNKDKRKDRPTTSKISQVQTNSTSLRPPGSK